MNINHLNIKVYLMQDIPKENVQNTLMKVIDTVLVKVEDYQKFHDSNIIKQYSFSGLMPLEKDGVYKEGKLYNFYLRTINDNLKDYLLEVLPIFNNNFLKVLTVDQRDLSFAKKQIVSAKTITPTVLRVAEDKFWVADKGDILELKSGIIANANHKYNLLTGQDESHRQFTIADINNLELLNKFSFTVTLTVGGNQAYYLANKIKVYFNPTENSQLLAKLIVGSGILELNSRGMGFVMADTESR